MRVAQAYLAETDEVRYIQFDKDIISITAEGCVIDREVLKRAYDKQKAKFDTAVGVVKGKGVDITLFSDGKFDGRTWSAGGARLSGTYKKL